MQIFPQTKRKFIEWFLSNHPPKQREVIWLLQYIMKRKFLLEKVRFVFEAQLPPRSIIISTDLNESRPFRFYKEHIVTTDVDKAFHDIRMNQNEILYMEMKYDNVRNSQAYLSVLEDNPYLPDDFYLENKDYEELDNFLNTIQKNQQRQSIQHKINQALDQGDEEEFLKWSKRLNEFTSEQTE